MLGDEYFREITHVSLFVDIAKGMAYANPLNVGSADLVLEKLAGQSGIKTLQMGGQQATDHGLEHVGRMSGLEELILFPARKVTDAGVAHLRGLKHLKRILIDQSHMTDEGLQTLAELPELEHLKLYRHSFSDAGLAHLKRATKLKTLLIGSGTSGVTDAGLASLQGLTDLEELDVSGSMVTDAGLDGLRGLTKLKDVGVNGTSVTKEGLKHFRDRVAPYPCFTIRAGRAGRCRLYSRCSHSTLTTLSARPLSPRTMLSLPFAAIFSRTSSSRSRMRVGLSASSFAVLAWLRMAAVSSRRAIRLASAAFLASVTLFIRSFISPGRITSRMPTEAIWRPSSPARRRTFSSISLATASLSVRTTSSSASTDRGPQDKLRVAVQRLPHVVRLTERLASIDDLVGHHSVQPQSDLVGRHDLLTADIDHRLPQVDLHHLGVRRALPECVLARRQRLGVSAVDEQHADAVALDRADIQNAVRQWRTDDHLELFVAEADRPDVDDFHADLLLSRPVGKLTRRQDVAESVLDPDERTALVVLQIQDDRVALERPDLTIRSSCSWTSHGSRCETTSTRSLRSGSRNQYAPAVSRPWNSPSRNSRPISYVRIL